MRGKARKKRKSRYAKLNGGRCRRFIYVKDKLQGEKNSRKSKVINMEYIIIGLKLKLKKKGKIHRPVKVQHRGKSLWPKQTNKKSDWGAKTIKPAQKLKWIS